MPCHDEGPLRRDASAVGYPLGNTAWAHPCHLRERFVRVTAVLDPLLEQFGDLGFFWVV